MAEHFIGTTMDKERAEKFKEFLREKGIYFEPAECGSLIHIEFKTEWTYDFIMRWFETWLKGQED